MLHGYDFSHYQSDTVFRKYLDSNPDFIILKASEGKTWIDHTFVKRANEVVERGIRLGAYHYARPENGNDTVHEVDNFIKQLMQVNICHIRCFLDVEDKAVSYPSWCRTWLEEFKKRNSDPVGIYCSLSVAKNQLKNVVNEYPLWIAHYSSGDKEGCKHFDGEIITQWSSKPVDQDVSIDMTMDEWYGFTSGSDKSEMAITDKERELIKYLRNNGWT